MSTNLPALTQPVGTAAAARGIIAALKPRMIQTMPQDRASDDEANRQAAVFINLISRVPKLLQCERQSLENAWLQTVRLGLEPSGPFGECFILPYKTQANFQIGAEGLKILAERSGKVRIPRARTVYANDEFEVEYGFEPTLKHKPNIFDPGEPIAYYALAILDDGANDFVVWTHARVEEHGKQFSRTYNSGPWQASFEAMAHKTMIIQLCSKLSKETVADLSFAARLDAQNNANIASQESGGAAITASEFDSNDIEIDAASTPAPEPAPETTSPDPEPVDKRKALWNRALEMAKTYGCTKEDILNMLKERSIENLKQTDAVTLEMALDEIEEECKAFEANAGEEVTELGGRPDPTPPEGDDDDDDGMLI